MTGAAALFPVMLFSTTKANLQLTAADCAAPEFSLGIAAAWWFPAPRFSFPLVQVRTPLDRDERSPNASY